ncbi:PadR family transcriptional regulator [Mycetocola tolaasinivorans]|uniref:PadR family transcriptional regulator n=1 Tax=Mycetocola tolaasinivorans TaxID=76635 RepID=A0A3L7A6W5_9MICO|nr:PadR family transcriptional regulator [Mycetocola tolaasinivorans]RLP75580.1 PadR family transcriptional regulator [Mycetocola tolaasinivorans]
MDNAQTLLGLLEAAPSHGYDLKGEYDRYFGGQKPLAFGQVYATLARLIRDGLILEAQGGESSGGPDRKSYSVTAAGRVRVREWMFTPDTPEPTLQSNLFAKTVIALLLDEDAASLLDAQRACHQARMRELTRAKRDADLATILTIDHALFHIEADLRWIELTGARLTELRAGVRGA